LWWAPPLFVTSFCANQLTLSIMGHLAGYNGGKNSDHYIYHGGGGDHTTKGFRGPA
jgi:hypothetical protein